MGFSQSKNQEEILREARAMERSKAMSIERLQNYLYQERLRQRLLAADEHRRQAEANAAIELRRQEMESLRWGIQSLSLRSREDEICIEKISKNRHIIQNLLQSIGFESWTNKVNDAIYVLETLENTFEFEQQKRHFRQTNKPCFKLKSIQKVYNPYLFLHYKLKEKECLYRGRHVKSIELFHGTKQINMDGICENNFNWRLSGSSTGNKFGKGVSFSPYSNYATNYGDKHSFDKIMFVTNVQVGQCTLGNFFTEIPDEPADTTVNEQKSVYVKYEDNSFYPAYVIHYEGVDRQKRNGRKLQIYI